jgi:hypothetical protein
VRYAALAVCILACIVPTSVALARQSAAAGASRRVATVEALRQFPGFYHLQNVLLRGEFADDGTRLLLRAGDQDIRAILVDDARTTTGVVEVRGQLIDVGRLEPGDPRVSAVVEGRDTERWPRPGEELFIRVTGATGAPPVLAVNVRALALEPWRYEGQKVTVTGNFRGRNLFGDLPGAPGLSRYDFVLRGTEGAIWVTGLRPRGRGFDLDVDRRVDTDQWLDVTGTVVRDRGLVRIEATQLAAAKAPQVIDVAEEIALPPPPPAPLDVVFASPSDGEPDVAAASPVRVQFSRGVDPASLPGAIRVSYVGGGDGVAPPAFKTTYDAATRAITLRFAQPFERFRTVRVEILDTLKAFDGGAARPWTLTFTIG